MVALVPHTKDWPGDLDEPDNGYTRDTLYSDTIHEINET